MFGCLDSIAQESGPDRAAIERSVRRAVEYLSREVAGWKDENRCYSCHNHGDGARALFAARRMKIEAAPAAITVSTQWLNAPDEWDHNGPDGPFSDRKLARIQFASALTAAVENRLIADRSSLVSVAQRLADEQLSSGTWEFDGADALGGPTTYGRALVTSMCRRVLHVADLRKFSNSIRRCDEWLCTFEAQSVIDASAVLWGLRDATDDRAAAQRKKCRGVLQQGQSEDGGWGPYVTSMSEPFDTALVLLALASEQDRDAKTAIARGQSYLIRLQLSDGSWPETTRPLPRESYSQRISTTAWATLALVGGR